MPCIFFKKIEIMNFDVLKNQLSRWSEKNRGSLHVVDERIVADCLELLDIIEQTEDEDLRKIHLVDLSVKLTLFFSCSKP
ncbi:MAG: hypothetical protein AAFP00_00485 [Bacteroidota bacterium]